MTDPSPVDAMTKPPSPTIEQLLQMPGSSWVKYSPWEREGYCDDQGRCWFQQYGKWILAHPVSVVNTVSCLPAHSLPATEATND